MLGQPQSRRAWLKEGRLSWGQDSSLKNEQGAGGGGREGQQLPGKGVAHEMAWVSETTWHLKDMSQPRGGEKTPEVIRDRMV